MHLRGQRLTLAMLAGSVLFTAVALTPLLHYAYRGPSVHLALETAAALIALLAAYLVFGRFQQTRSVGDLALVYALGLFGSTNLFFAAVTSVSGASGAGELGTWAPTVTRVLAAVAFTAGAFAQGRRVRDSRGAARFAVAACVATLATVTTGTAILAPLLPTGIPAGTTPGTADGVLVAGHPALVLAQTASALLFLAAALGFSRRARRTSDELLHLLAASAVLGGFASVHYALFPSLYSQWVYTGDILRLGFYVLLSAGAAGEIKRYWESRTRAAVLEERRRVARDLHDGLAHELALIARQSRQLLDDYEPELAGTISSAAQRALAESRKAISTLSSSSDEHLGTAIGDASQQAAARFGARVEVKVARDFDLPPDMREELVRIAAEAVTNAGRHGRASVVRVELTNGAERRLRVRDNGVGFDLAEPPGFGITIMRERARSIGGELHLSSTPGRGTDVEVVFS